MLAIVTRTHAQAKGLQLRLLASCAMATSMISAGAVQAATSSPPPLTGADAAFQGIGTVVSGIATIVQTPTLDTITVATPQTVINFTPFDTVNGGGPITFLPSGRTGLFQNDPNSGVTNFTVLNRIIPTDATRAIRFDGTVQSRIVDAIGGSTPGGTILFYSPGGIIASSSAVFDVGSLVLSAADIGFGAGSNSFSFSGAAAGTTVDINNGASILAQGVGSYVALVAPRVIQSGSVKSDGSVGYIAAEAVDVTIQNNLFDISFVQGTDGGAAVSHTGTTELTRAPNDTSPQRIYVAAVPKNDAITTLISGSLGYSAATSASVRNGAVILSAGRNVSDSGYGASFTDFTAGTAPANITIGTDGATIFNASLLTNATGDALIAPSAGTTIQFNNSVALNADRLAEVRAVATSSALFNTGLSVSSNNLVDGAAAHVIALGETGYGGSSGLISVTGNLVLDGGPSQGVGEVRTPVSLLAADLGRITVSGSAIVKASDSDAMFARNAFGGSATVRVGAAGSQLSAAGLVIEAGARGVAGLDENEMPIAGDATGGTASLILGGGTFAPIDVSFDSSAVSDLGGVATGGTASLVASGGVVNLGTIMGNVSASALQSGDSGVGPQKARGATFVTNEATLPSSTGGTIQFDVTDTAININGDLLLNASASGSEGNGALQGGTIAINANNGSLLVGDLISANVSAEESASALGVQPGEVRGGTITTLVSNNGDILASAMNYGANAVSGGDTFGGAVSLTTDSGGRIRSTGTIGIDASAMTRGLESAGDAVGGNIVVSINSGSLQSGPLILDANALGGDAIFGGIGGSALGGSARVNISGGDSVIESFRLTTDATGGRGGLGNGGAEAGGTGGAATAGTSEINITSGVVRTAGLVISSEATGGNGGEGTSGGAGGAALGGQANVLTSDAATLFLMKLPTNPAPTPLASSVDSSARGGSGGLGQLTSGGAGGAATGGTSVLTLAGADIQPNTPRFAVDLTVNSEASGGLGGASSSAGGGAGGSATGGSATLNLVNNHIDFANIALSTRGSGGSGGSASNSGYGALGAGGAGGNGSAGMASVTATAPVANMVSTNIANLSIVAEAVGGSGGNGSDGGNGGNALNTGSASFTHTAGAITSPLTLLTTNSFGGRGGDGFVGNGGNGGNSLGGTARITVDGATANSTINVAGMVAVARSGAGGIAQSGGSTADSGNAGTATGGTSELNVSSGAALVANSVTMSANAMILGGSGGGDATGPTASAANGGMSGGMATGGTVSVNVNNATALLTQTLGLTADAEAQIGTAQGGTVNIVATGGTLTTPSTIVTANGSSLVTGTEIGGRGGIINIRSERAANGTAGVLNLGSANLEASGYSTLLDDPAAATNATAGRINIAANGGQTTATNFSTLLARTLGRNTSGFNPNNGIFLSADQGGILANNTVTLLSDESIAVSAMATGNLFVGDSLSAEALNTITVNHTGRSANANTILAGNASLTAGNDFNAMPGSRIRADNDLTITSTLGGVSAGDLVAGDDIAVGANSLVNITGLALTTGAAAMGGESDISIVTPGDVTVNMVDAFGNFRVNSASLLANGSIMAGEDVDLLTTGAITTQAISAGDDVFATSNSGNISVLSATARGTGPDDGMGDADVVIRSTSGAITLGAAMSNDEIVLSTAGNITANNLTTTGLGLGLDAAANRSNIIIDSGAAVLIDNINSQTSLAVRGASITASNLTAGEDIALSASGDISVTTALAADDFSTTSSAGSITLTGITTNANGADDRTVNFGYGEISFGLSAANGSDIDATAGYGTITLGTLNAANDLTVSAQAIAALAPAALVAGQDISLTGQTAVNVSDANAGRDFSLTSNGTASVVNVTAGDDIDVTSSGLVSITNALTDGSFNSGYGGDPSNISVSTSFFGGAIVTTGRAKDNLTITTGVSGANSAGSLTADRGNILVNGQMSANIALATATVGSVTLNAALVNANTVSAGTDANVNFIINSTLGTVAAARDITVTGSSSAILTATSFIAGDDIAVMTGGNATITSALATGSLNSGYGSDPSNLNVTSATGAVSLATGRAKDNLTLTAATGVTSTTSLIADRGAVLVNGGTSATLMNTTATLGAVTINADGVNATNVNAATNIGVNFGASALLGTLVAGNDLILNGTGNATIGSATAMRDVVAMVGGDVVITSASAGRNLRNTSANLTATTLGAGTDVIVITDAAANLGTTTAGARIVANAGTDISFTQLMSGTTTSLVAGTSITGGNANAGTALTLNANGGAIAFGMLSSGASTSITASNAITGNSANAGGALTLNSGANGITATTLTSGGSNNLTVTASNGGNATITTTTSGLDLSVNATAVSVATGNAARDVLYTAASNIIAGTTSAGRNVALNAVGTINATTTTAAANIVANSTGSASLVTSTADNIFAVSTGDVTLGTANATTMLGVNAQNISGTTLTAGEDIRLIASSTANVTSATAGDDVDISATNGITLGNITALGTARDDRSLAFNAPAFAIVAAPADGSDIRLTSNGAVNADNLDAGDDIRVDSGDFTLSGLARTRGLGITDTGSDVVINGDAVTVAMVNAASNLSVNSETFAGTSLIAGGAISVITSEDQSLGTANAAQGPITGNSTRGTISFIDLSTSGDISLNAGDAIAGGSADAGGSIQFTASNGVNFDNLTSGGSTNISGGASVSGDNISADGNIFVGSDIIDLGSVTSNFASIFLGGRDITVGTAGARFDFNVDTSERTNSRIALGDVIVGRDILLTGATNGLTATSLMAGDDIDIDIIGNAKIGLAITDGSFNGGYGDDGYGDVTRPVRIGNEGYGDWGYGSDLSNITLNAAQAMIGTAQARDNITLTTVTGTMAGTVVAEQGDILINGGTSANIMQSTATLGSITINADTVTADSATAGDAFSVNFGGNASLGTVNAGSDITVTGNGNAAFMSLTSGNETAIMAGGNVTGGVSTAGGLLSVMADSIDVDTLTSTGSDVVASARIVDIGTTTAARDVLIDTKGLANSSITLGTVTANRDIGLTGGTNGITATSLTAGDDIDVVGSGKATITNALTNGSFNSGYGDHGYGDSGYGTDPSNITVNATQAMLGTAQARDDVTLTTMTGTMANTVIADRGNILVNGGTTANIMQSTATLGSVTINAGTVDAVTVNAGTDVGVNFGASAILGTVVAGDAINITGTGNAAFMSLTSGNETVIMAGGNVTGGTATAGGLLSVMAGGIDVDTLTSTGSDVVASARIIDIGTTTAARDALIDTKGLANSSITLGAVTANRDIGLTGGTNGITATSLTAGDDIDVVGAGNVNIISAAANGTFNSGYGEVADPSNLNVTANSGTITLGTGRAKDNVTLTTTGGATAATLTADQGAILVNGGATANIAQSTATLGSITINADTVTAGSATAADGFSVNFGGNASLGTVNAGGVISVSGTGDATFTSLTSGGATSIMAGNTLIGGTSTAGGLLSVMADSIDVDSLTSTGSSVIASARTVDIGTTSAAVDALIDTKGLANSSITLGTVTAGRDIGLTGGTNGIIATNLTAGDDIDVVGSDSAVITSALTTGGSNTGYGDSGYGSDLSNITLSATQAMIGTARAKDNVSLTTTNGTTATALIADRGAITVRGGTLAMIDSATATLANVDIMANRVTTGTVNAGTDVAIAYVSDASLGAVTAGTSIDISGTGSASFTSLASGTTTRANVGAALSGGAINAGTSLSATTGGAFTTTGPITAGTSATITSGSITTANATAGGALSLTANQGAIGTSDLTGGTGVQLRGSSSATTGNITASANNVDIVLASGLTGGNVTAANNVMIVNTAGAVTAGALSAGNNIVVTNGGAVTLASAAGSDITLGSTANAINVNTVTARGALAGTAATALTLGTATAGSTIALTGQTINATALTASTNITGTASGAMMIGSARATGGNLTLNAAGPLSVTTGGALGDVRLTSTNSGNITTGTLSSGSAFMGGTTGGMPGAGDIVITSDGNATMTGNSSAGRNLNVTARNLISVGGVANGTAIDLRSTDIAVNTTSGRIGEQGRTTLAQLTNTGTGVTTIGGAGATTGYSLSNAEAQRIFAGDIIITAARTIAPSTGTLAPLNDAAPDVVLDALTLTGATGQTGATAGNIGATGRLRIETPGKLRTVGAVAISNLASANRFQINAAQSIEVDAATGSVSLSGAGGALSGTIELTAPSVIAASLTAIGSVAAAADGRAVSDRLAINDNAISDVGTFSADSIVVNVSNGFFVQNSGIKELNAFSFGDRRGITVGAGGLTINAASAATRIFVSGRQLQPNGSFITGIDFLRAQTINGTRIQLSTFPPTPFDPASTINGCAIVTASTCLVTIDGGSLARDVVGQNDDDSGGSSEGNGSGNNDFVRFEFKALDSSNFAAVIDDPVTGVGNDDLWALYDARDCTDDQSLESCAKAEAKPE
jgi:hypothetical protein